MSYANGTNFLNLPQTVGTDHRDWFDTNEAFLELDTKMKTLWDGAASTADILEQLQETVSGLDTDLSALQTVVDGHTTTLQTVNESLVLINSALTSLNSDVHTKFDSAGIADPYDPTYGIYDVDDIVTYNGQRYKCVTAVTAAEPFDADKWLAEDIQTVIDSLNSDLDDVETTLIDKVTNIAVINNLEPSHIDFTVKVPTGTFAFMFTTPYDCVLVRGYKDSITSANSANTLHQSVLATESGHGITVDGAWATATSGNVKTIRFQVAFTSGNIENATITFLTRLVD